VDFHQLAKEICNRFLLEDPARLVAGQTMDVDGVQAAMHWNQYEKPGRFTLIVDFGVPAATGANVYATLLARNFDLIGNDAGMFALDPGNQHVLYARTFEIEKVIALDVIDALMEAVAEAKKWQMDTRNS
jgi:hypothetical protein